MGDMRLSDPRTTRFAYVDKEHHLLVRSVTSSDYEHAAEANSDAYILTSTFATGGSDIEVIALQNDDPNKDLHIDRIYTSSSVATLWTFGEATGTLGGTIAIPNNTRPRSGKVSTTTAYANAAVTGQTLGAILGIGHTPASGLGSIDFGGAVILEKDDRVALTASANGTVAVTIEFHMDDPKREAE